MATINGTNGDNTLNGTSGSDTINAKSGDDIVVAGGGSDAVDAGAGNDQVDGGSGNDEIDGGSGNDTLLGGSGNDEIEGGSGNDVIDGGVDDDEIAGGSGDDAIQGGSGDDEIDAGSGNDTVAGGSGDDEIEGGSGNDTIDGGADDDDLDGDAGDDVILGSAGRDDIDGGSGNDSLDGGEGDDEIEGGEGNDVILGGTGKDEIDGGSGNDTIDGGANDDKIEGGAGNDTITGGAGNDVVEGGTGNDTLDGGAGSDIVRGEKDSDLGIYVASENAGASDTYDGSKGTDKLRLVLTSAQHASAAVQADIAAYQAFLAQYANANADNGPTFHFNSFGLHVRNFEQLEIVVTGGPANQAPTDITLSNSSVAENASGATIGSVTVTDPNSSDTHSFTVSDTRFEVVGGVLRLKAGQSLDFEATAMLSLTITATDAGGLSYSETFVINVTDVNEAPDARNDTFAATEDQQLAGNILVNNGAGADTDPDTGTSLSVVAGTFATSQGGSVVLQTNGSFVYTPAPNFNGTDSFQYTLSDGSLTDTATATVNVAAVNDAPVARDDSFAAVEDQQLIGNVLANNGAGADSDVEGGVSAVPATIATSQGGTVVLQANGSFIYTPAANFHGTDTFFYQITDSSLTDTGFATIAVSSVNDAPTAFDDTFSTAEDTPLSGNVLANNGAGADSDIDGSVSAVPATIATSQGGTVVLLANGSFTYTPAANFHGTDTFSYQVTDGSLTDTGLATISVPAVNDVASITGTAAGAVTEAGATPGTPFTSGDLDVSDADAGQAVFQAPAGLAGTYGTFTFDSGSGAWSYTLNNGDTDTQGLRAGQTVQDTLAVTSFDGSDTETIAVSVHGANDAPTDLTLSGNTVVRTQQGAQIGTLSVADVDIGDNHSFTVSDSRFEVVGNTLKLKAGQNLSSVPPATTTLAIDVTVNDGGASYTETFTINLVNSNPGPTGLNINNTTVAENAAGALIGILTPVDASPSDLFSYQLFDAENRFEVVGNELRLRPGVSLDHEAGSVVNVLVQVTDSGNSSFSQSFAISVTNANDAPSGVTLTAGTVTENAAGAIIGTLTAADQDLGDSHTFSVGDSRFEVVGNQLKLKPGQSLDFEAGATVTVDVTATDAGGASVTTPVTFNVGNVNDAPDAILLNNLSVNEETDGAVVGAITVVDDDAGDAHALTVSDARFEIAGGQLKLKSGEKLDYDGEFGETSVTVTVTATDAQGLSTNEDFTITVNDGADGESIDGYIAGATVFADANGDGVLDPGEVSAITDNQGSFTLFGAPANARLVLTGGIDISSGQAFTGMLTAPAGSSVVTPLTTLVQSLLESNPGMTLAEAQANVLAGLGLDDGIDIANYDPIQELLATNSDAARAAMAASIQVQNTIAQTAALIDGAGASAGDALAAAVSTLATQVNAAASTVPIDLSDSGVVTALVTDSAAAASVTVDVASATAVISDSNGAAQEQLSAPDATALLTGLAQVQIVAQGDAAQALADDPTQAAADYTGAALDTAVIEAAAEVGDLDGAFIGTSGNDTPPFTSGVDIIEGRAGLDTLNGGDGNDQLLGGQDDDVLIGGAGSDALDGGSGISIGGSLQNRVHVNFGDFDTASYSGASGPVSVNLATGIAVETPVASDTLANIEGVRGSAFSDTLVGGSAASLDPIIGQEGFIGMAGADTITGGAGFSQVSYIDDPTGISVDLALGQARDGWGDTDTLSGIEAVYGSQHADTLLGSNNAQGLERFRGRGGNDTIDGRGGFDEVDYWNTAAAIGVLVNLQLGFANDGLGGTDNLANIEAVRGSEQSDTLIGTDGGFNRFRPMAGNDVVHAANGTELGGNTDELDYNLAPNAVSINLAMGLAADGWGGTDTLIGTFENANGGVFTNDIIIGNALNNVLRGFGGDDTIYGGAGGDQLFGGDGNDTLYGEAGGDLLQGEAGNDILYGGFGEDALDGGAGSDLLDGGEGVIPGGFSEGKFHPLFGDSDVADYRTSTTAVTVTFTSGNGSGTGVDGAGATDTLVNLEGAFGSAFNDTIMGADADPRLGGFAYVGMQGNDVITGGTTGLQQAMYNQTNAASIPGSGVSVNLATGTAIDNWGNTDTLTNITAVVGSDNADTLIGNALNNRLRGRAGNDTLDGGDGIDEADYVNSNAFTGATVNLAVGQATNDGRGFTDTLISIENIRGSELGDTLTGDGNANRFRPMGGNDTIDGGGGNDEVDYFNAPVAVTVDLVAGTAIGGSPGDTDSLTSIENIGGTMESDTLRGDANNNRIRGDDGNDVIAGRGGNDQLEGGAGDDVYEIALGDGVDTINDSAGFETLRMSSSLFSIKDSERVGNDLVITLDDGSQYTITGQYAGTPVEQFEFLPFSTLPYYGHFAVVAFNNGLTGNTGAGDHDEWFTGAVGADTIDAGDGSDYLFGRDGNDTLLGGAGDDWIEGGIGADTMDGGTQEGFSLGVDFVVYKNSDAAVTVNLGTGVVSGGDAQGDTIVNFEGVIGSDFADTLTGSANTFWRDRFIGRGGNDIINGGSGSDGIDHVDSPTGVIVNLSNIAQTVGLTVVNPFTALDGWGGTDSLTSIEEARGSRHDDTLIGSDATNFGERFRGREGNDYIDGRNGFDEVDYINSPAGISVNLVSGVATDGFGGTDTLINIEAVRATNFVDTLIGNEFNNQFQGVSGADFIDGGAGFDTADYSFDFSALGLAGITVNLGLQFGIDGFGFTDTLISIERVVGSQGNDTLIGSGANETFVGQEGADYIDGAGDTFNPGNTFGSGDIVDYNFFNATAGVTINLETGTASGGPAQGDTLVDIEGARGTNFGDTLIGDSGQNSLAGNGGADIISGGDGEDSIDGGAGGDTIDGGAGIDWLTYFGSTAAVTVDLSTGIGTGGDAQGDTITGVERLFGSNNFGDRLTGSSGDDSLFGLGGNDTLIGGAGNDSLDGGPGNDRYVVRRLGGNDTIFDASGNDTLFFDIGTLGLADVRQQGNNLVFQLLDGSTTTVINHFAGNAIEVVEYAALQGFESLASFGITTVLTPGAGNTIMVGSDLDEGITAGNGVNYIFAHGGADTITGGTHDDFIEGGEGGDVIDGGAHNGILQGGDFATYATSNEAVTINLGTNTHSGGHAAGDSLLNIEGVVGSVHDDTLIGRNGPNDRLIGNAGNDTIDGLNGFDQVEYSDSPGRVAINLSNAAVTVDLGMGPVVLGAGLAIDGFGATDTLISIEGARGSSFDDVIIGSDRTDVTELFRGRGGADIIDGRGGADEVSYITNTAAGAVDLSNPVVPVSLNLDSVMVLGIAPGTAVTAGVTDTLFNIEHVDASLADDVLIGSAANNQFRGNAGNDYMDGRGGFDTANYANDPFLFGPAAVTVNLAAGFAIDGWGNTDTLVSIENAVGTGAGDTLVGDGNNNFFTPLGGADIIDGGLGNDTVGYFSATSGVTMNLTTGLGTGGEAAGDTYTGIENLQGSNSGASGDHLTGDGNANQLVGNAGNDMLFGMGGDDNLNGGAGADALDGGAGTADIANYFNAATGVTVNLSTGLGSGGEAAGDTYTGIENVGGSNASGSGDHLIGDGGQNRLLGNAGNDTLDGGAGFDILIGGAGADILIGGGSSFDTADYSSDASSGGGLGVTVNLALGSATDGFGNTDTLSDIANVTGTNVGDTLNGDGSANWLRGEGGGDTLDGGDGDDTLIGGSGNDSLDGGLGIRDTADYSAAGSSVTVSLLAGTANDGQGGSDTLTNIEIVRGSQFADMLIGDTGDNVFEGMAGGDAYSGGDGNDMAQYAFEASLGAVNGIVADLAAGTITDGFGFTDSLLSIESVNGSNFSDTIRGNSDANTLIGAGGDDLIEGREGVDVLQGRSGIDTLDGGIGVDTASYDLDFLDGGFAGVSVDLAAGTATDGFGHSDTLIGIENVSGTANGDTLLGDAGDNALTAGNGADTLNGRGGNDTLTGGDGDDLFVFDAGNGQDTVIGFTTGATSEDILDLSAFGFADFAAVLAAADDSGGTGPTVIDLGGGNSVTLLGVIENQLHPDDLILS